MKINDKEGGGEYLGKKVNAPHSFLYFSPYAFRLGEKWEFFKSERTSTVFNAMSVVINIYVVIEERVPNLCIWGIKSSF